MSKNRLKAEFRRAVLLRLNRRRQTQGEDPVRSISNAEILSLCDTLVELFDEAFAVVLLEKAKIGRWKEKGKEKGKEEY
jgi:hypothetical protein